MMDNFNYDECIDLIKLDAIWVFVVLGPHLLATSSAYGRVLKNPTILLPFV